MRTNCKKFVALIRTLRQRAFLRIGIFLTIFFLVMTGIFFALQENGVFVYTLDKSMYIVNVSASGFSPDELIIHQYDSVEFVNLDTKVSHAPASDPHPTHDIYPQFDSGIILPGKSWTFQFNRIGEWHYHDHDSPYLTGEITVLP